MSSDSRIAAAALATALVLSAGPAYAQRPEAAHARRLGP